MNEKLTRQKLTKEFKEDACTLGSDQANLLNIIA